MACYFYSAFIYFEYSEDPVLLGDGVHKTVNDGEEAYREIKEKLYQENQKRRHFRKVILVAFNKI